MSEKLPGRYDVRYEYEHEHWSVEILADSFDEAESKLAAIANSGRIVGRITGSVYVRKVQ